MLAWQRRERRIQPLHRQQRLRSRPAVGRDQVPARLSLRIDRDPVAGEVDEHAPVGIDRGWEFAFEYVD